MLAETTAPRLFFMNGLLIMRFLNNFELVVLRHKKEYLGAAHGLSGVLQALLRLIKRARRVFYNCLL